jgi:cytoskeletal protein CcmA (bactofilin family)
MIAGAGVTVKGDMQCDMLRVEGNIEGNVKARKLEISAGGALLGTADIEDAEIEGRFEGTLSVAGLLIVRSTGRVSGKFHYGNIEIERGGTISGEVQAHGSEPLNHAANTVASAPKPANITPSDDTKSLRNTAFGRS